MKKIALFVITLSLFALWSPRSSQAQASLAGTGYPTSMPICPCDPVPPLLPGHKKPGKYPNLEIVHEAKDAQVASTPPAILEMPVQPVAASTQKPEIVTITDRFHHSVAKQPLAQGPYEMYFTVPIENLRNQCGGLQPGNFEIGYDFQVAYDSHGIPSSDPHEMQFGRYGPGGRGTLQAFNVSIFRTAAHPVALPEDQLLLMAQREQNQVHSPAMFPIVSKKPSRSLNGKLLKTGYGRYSLPQQAAQYFVPGNTLVLHAVGFQNIYVGVWCNNSK